MPASVGDELCTDRQSALRPLRGMLPPCLQATRAASRAAFQRIVYESEENRELGAAIIERICRGTPSDSDDMMLDHPCFLVQRAALDSRTK